ncbi:hypothetical protein [Streptomyces sp. NPDC006551]|uniref:hypothetical protein n=1 Tax=Streptomyces sp. NPDC006551 TaxID=3157178 RepID=UPI0033B06205
MARTLRSLQLITRFVDGRICVYNLATGATGVLSPVMAIQPPFEDDVVDHAVATGLQHAYYTTLDALVCVAADGTEVWRSQFDPQAAQQHGHRPGCMLSWDERVVWVYRPDAMAGRNRADQWVAFDAGAGTMLAQVDLETVGHGGQQLRHPADDQVFLDVGEGQDGSVIYRAVLNRGRIDLTRYPWDDRCLIGLAPDGNHFMTVHHEQTDVAVHTCPDGEVKFVLTVDAFGHDPEQIYVEWSGGYLSPDTLIVTLTGETEDEQEWVRHYRVDAHSGHVRTEFHAETDNPYDIQPLGDGTWLTTDGSGHPVRWTDS